MFHRASARIVGTALASADGHRFHRPIPVLGDCHSVCGGPHRYGLTAAVLLSAAIPLFFLTLKPIDEPDSANYLHFLLEWRAGHSTPYNFSTYYVAFGTSRFLPALVLSRTDWFFGFVALEPVLLLGLGLYLVAAELEIPPRLRLWSVAAAVALQHLWGSHSGVGTLKADSVHAAGVVLLALVLLRAARSPGRFSPLLFALALVFATEKYTGVFIAILAISALVWLRVPIARMLPAAALVLVTTGHYYLHSLFLWRNPFYPFTVRFGPFELPGVISAILDPCKPARSAALEVAVSARALPSPRPGCCFPAFWRSC